MGIFVIHIRPYESEIYDLSTVVTEKVQLEAVAPFYRALAVCGETFEDIIGIASEVVTDGHYIVESTKLKLVQRPKAERWRNNTFGRTRDFRVL